ncbi:diaminopropionate ammonia-lyase [Enterovirga aerilata]|uniref:Diaminopropionate ammonia-lyase n=1 Tax=Enterovirga aerilata TaxID=2730920 RepID=A0A849ICR7_9HYPH|nr:diaminopropionate ammonia-lyase [Enterovirga sp. DB1703]NNM75198.1 diaminopropionate ammonia-lyase [Enterovirga sp. DB1703]
MLIRNLHAEYGAPLDPRDADMLSVAGADAVGRFLARHPEHGPTPLVPLPGLARELGVADILVKDEGQRLGLGSFKALGGAYAVARLALEEAGRALGRDVPLEDLDRPEVRAVVAGLTFGCATDGNHGRSVAWGARLVGAASAIFVHGGVSDERVSAIARYGARTVRVPGTYDDSVAEAARVCAEKGWIVVSDTSWEGYERVPGLVMQGYTAIVREALRQMPEPPTHVFIQAGVGGVAASLAGHFALLLGEGRPALTVVEPARAACIFETARAGHPVGVSRREPTVMAMLECYEPSPLAWRVLSRAADAFMTVEDEDAVRAMRRLARPVAGDPAIVAGESGCAGLAGLMRAAAEPSWRKEIGLGPGSRVFLVNTEGATDPALYRRLTGLHAAEVARAG